MDGLFLMENPTEVDDLGVKHDFRTPPFGSFFLRAGIWMILMAWNFTRKHEYMSGLLSARKKTIDDPDPTSASMCTIYVQDVCVYIYIYLIRLLLKNNHYMVDRHSTITINYIHMTYLLYLQTTYQLSTYCNICLHIKHRDKKYPYIATLRQRDWTVVVGSTTSMTSLAARNITTQVTVCSVSSVRLVLLSGISMLCLGVWGGFEPLLGSWAPIQRWWKFP